MSNIIIPNSINKNRVTNTSNVIGIIPNKGTSFSQQMASTNKDANSRVNYVVFATGITALAGGGKTDATQLDNRAVQIVETVETADDSVMLTKAVPNLFITIMNTSAADLDVYSQGDDTLNGSDADPFIIAAGSSAIFVAVSSTAWIATL